MTTTEEIVQRFRSTAWARLQEAEALEVPGDAVLHLIERPTGTIVVLTVELPHGPAVLIAGGAPDTDDRHWAEPDHLGTLPSGGELWVVAGARDLRSWVERPVDASRRRQLGLDLARLGVELDRARIRHGSVEAALVAIDDDGRPLLLPWTGDRDDDLGRLHALGLSVLATAADPSTSDVFGELGLLAPDDLAHPGVGSRWDALTELSTSRRTRPDLRYAIERLHEATVAACSGDVTESVLDPDVRFTAFHPPTIPTQEWSQLLVLAHRGGDATDGTVVRPVDELVAELVADALGPDIDPVRTAAPRAVPLGAGDALTIAVAIEGAQVDHDRTELVWTGPIEEAVFWLLPDAGVVSAAGTVEIFVGPVLRGRIDVTIPVGGRSNADAVQTTVDPYRDVFVSYAHEDRAIVDAVTRHNSLGDRFLIDANELRAGEDWRERLAELIDEAEVFQLFWSAASSRSAEVEVEWRRALEQRPEANFIRPVFWEEPMPVPPASLGHLHFQELDLGDDPDDRRLLGGGATPPPPPPGQPGRPDVMFGRTPGAAATGPTGVEASASGAGTATRPVEQPEPQRSRAAGLSSSMLRMAMVLIALFGIGAVYSGLVVDRDDGASDGPLSDDPGAPAESTAPPVVSTAPTSSPPETTSPPATVDPTSPPPSTSAPPTPSSPPSSVPSTSSPPSSAPSTTADVPPSSTTTPASSTTSTTADVDPPPGVSFEVGDDVTGTDSTTSFSVIAIVSGEALLVEAIVAVSTEGRTAPADAPTTPLVLEPGTTVLGFVIPLPPEAIVEVILTTPLGPFVLTV